MRPGVRGAARNRAAPVGGRRLRTSVLLGSCALAVLVAGIFIALFALIGEQRSAERARDRGARVVMQANQIQKLTLDLETGQRGFVITGDPKFLDPWRRARAVYRDELAKVVRLSDETEVPDGQLARTLAAAGSSYLSELSEPLVAETRRSLAAGRRRVALGDGKRRGDRIRSLATRLIDAERQHAQDAGGRARDAQDDAIVAGVVGLGGALTVIVLFALYILRAIVRPVGSVADAADRLSGGDLSRRVPVGGPREVAQLGESFNHMTARLEQNRAERAAAEQALRDSEERLQAILDYSAAVIFVKDLDGRYTLVNRRFEELFGAEGEEITGKTAADVFGRDVAARLRANQRAVLEVGGAIAAEESIPCKGEQRTYLTTLFPLRDLEGSIYAICGMATDISDRKRAERAAEEARRGAETANQAKSRFLSRMSHELRTPLNAILGFGQLLELDDLNETQRDSVDLILKGGRHLLRLINEVLEISRIEAGELPISLEPVDVGIAVTEVVELMGPLAAEREVRIEVTTQEGTPAYVRADYQRLRQVLLNLVSNGIKYNRRGGTLSLRIEPGDEGFVRVSVADTGSGIPRDQLPRLFTPFERLDADSQEIEGTGLGLALSKRLVEAMAGTIAVESEFGSGTTFTVELSQANGQLEGHEPDARSEHAPDGRAAASRQRKVLCIEDNVSNVTLLERIFATIPGVELLAAGQGSLALELARQHAPNLILLDLNLPDIPGDQVLRALQADETTRRIPVVVLSADATERQVERLLAMGVRDYLTKPFDVKRLREVIEESLSRPLG